MTTAKFLDRLTEEAELYRTGAIESLERNWRSHRLLPEELKRLKRKRKLTQRTIDAVLVNFINHIGAGLGLNYGLKTDDIQGKNNKNKRR